MIIILDIKKLRALPRSSSAFLAPFFKVVAIRLKSRLVKFKKKLESLQNKIYITHYGIKNREILWSGKKLSVHNTLKIRRELDVETYEYFSISDKIVSFFFNFNFTKICYHRTFFRGCPSKEMKSVFILRN